MWSITQDQYVSAATKQQMLGLKGLNHSSLVQLDNSFFANSEITVYCLKFNCVTDSQKQEIFL